MKYRSDYVSNSSSSSFIIHNNTGEPMTAKEVAYHLVARILEDAKEEDFMIPPHDSITLECGDHPSEDGAFQTFIHNELGEWGLGERYGDGYCAVKFVKSHH